MDLFRSLLAGMSVLFLSACGNAFEAAKMNLSSFEAPVELLAYDCKTDQSFSVVNSASRFAWKATKTSGEVVTGTHQIAASFVGSAFDMLNPRMLIDFRPATLNTGVDLRNMRIMNVVFGVASNVPMEFAMTSLSATSGQTDWPPIGETKNYTVDGDLKIMGIVTPINVRVNVTRTVNGLTVKPENVVTLDVRGMLGLSNQIAELLALVPGVGMNDDVSFEFELNMRQACPGNGL